MKKFLLLLICLSVMFFASTQVLAVPVEFVSQGDTWNYSAVGTDLWTDWSTNGYSSFDWNAATWTSGNAAFGNTGSYSTYWAANTDIALQATFALDGILTTPITLNVASDNGFMIFINGTEVAKQNAEGFTTYWEYSFVNTFSPSLFNQGSNVISVLAEDHGGATFFDMQLTGEVERSVPEPATMLLLGTGLIGLAGLRRRFKK